MRDFSADALRLVDDLKMLTGSAYYDRIESELMEAEERGRRLENGACAANITQDLAELEAYLLDYNIKSAIAKARQIRARLEEK